MPLKWLAEQLRQESVKRSAVLSHVVLSLCWGKIKVQEPELPMRIHKISSHQQLLLWCLPAVGRRLFDKMKEMMNGAHFIQVVAKPSCSHIAQAVLCS